MGKKPLRSTAFRSGRSYSKSEQEGRVGQLFKEGYEQATGIRLEGNNPGGDPPDRLFSYQNLTIGVEMFELGQFYNIRALFENLTNRIYSEFESRGASKRYEGTRIDFGILKDIKAPKALINRWQEKGIRRKQESTFAEQFVNLFIKEVPSRDAIPKRRRVIEVDPELYPAVSALTERIIIDRCPINTTLRANGKAAPLVIISPGYLIGGSEIEESIENEMMEKIQGRPKWKSPVDHSVLVAHDVPRGRLYEGFVFTTGAHKWLLRAASTVGLLREFDELWFVTPFDVVDGGRMTRRAQRICGRELGQHSG